MKAPLKIHSSAHPAMNHEKHEKFFCRVCGAISPRNTLKKRLTLGAYVQVTAPCFGVFCVFRD